MSLPARSLAALSVLALAGLALWAVFRPVPAAAAPRAFESSQQCRQCHEQAWNEWSLSQHAQSWTNPDVRALSNDYANTDCIDCHAPRGVFETGIGARVLPRSARRAEGVDCIACHLLPETWPGGGGVAGTLDRPDAACQPRAVVELARPEFCAPCHDQHQTVTQWRESRWAQQKVGCLDCHMPFRGGDPNQGRDHVMHGGHSLAMVRRAVELRAWREAGTVLAEVENVGAGHHFPTDERSRAADLFWRPLAANGEPPGAWRWLYRFRSPYRHETGVEDTLLPAHATRRVAVEDAASSGALEVALFYKRTPYWKDPQHPDPLAEAELVHSKVVAP